jgi:hypothetical protein
MFWAIGAVINPILSVVKIFKGKTADVIIASYDIDFHFSFPFHQFSKWSAQISQTADTVQMPPMHIKRVINSSMIGLLAAFDLQTVCDFLQEF